MSVFPGAVQTINRSWGFYLSLKQANQLYAALSKIKGKDIRTIGYDLPFATISL